MKKRQNLVLDNQMILSQLLLTNERDISLRLFHESKDYWVQNY